MVDNINIILRGRKFKKLVERAFSGIRKKYELRQVEIEILLYLNTNPDTNSSEIHRHLVINKGHVSQAMDNLCKKGYLISEQDQNDRRYVSYTITPRGKEIIAESFALRNALMQQLFAGISAEEIELMQKLSTKLCDNIDRIV